MKKFGFLSFGHYGHGMSARDSLHDQLELAVNADELGVDGAYFRVHHFAAQGAAVMPMLSAVAARTKRIEVGTGVIDMRYENPLHFAEEAAALDMIADGRVALGISRGAPELADKGWEAFGYHAKAPNGSDMAYEKFYQFMAAIKGEPVTRAAQDQYPPNTYPVGAPLPIMPHSPRLYQRIWWGAGTMESAIRAAKDGVNLMSSTLVSEADGRSLGEVQFDQIMAFKDAWEGDFEPRVSVSRTIFPIVDEQSRRLFGAQGSSRDQIGTLGEGRNVTFGRTYAAEPDVLIEQLKADPALMEADTLMLTIPNQLGCDFNTKLLADFAQHVAPALQNS